MKVLILIPSINPVQGGPVIVLEQFARYQCRDGDTLHVVSFDDPASEAVKAFAYPLTALGPCSTFYGYTEKLVPWLKAHARDYDVAMVHGIWQYHSLAASRVLRRLGVSYAVYTHGMLDPGHNKVSRFKQFKKQIYWWLAESQVLRAAAVTLFTTEEERRLAPKGMWPVRWRSSAIVPYGLDEPTGKPDVQREIFLARFPELKGRRILLFLGRFDPKKGVRMLLNTFAEMAGEHRDVTLVMAGPGEGTQVDGLKKLVPDGLKGRVLWTGLLLGDEKWGAFHAAEAFIIPSHTENYCIAAVEALACGVPVLMSDKVNIHSGVTAHEAGFVENDDEQGCRRLMERWLTTPGERWMKMRENALICYRKEFVISVAYECYRNVLTRLAESDKRGSPHL